MGSNPCHSFYSLQPGLPTTGQEKARSLPLAHPPAPLAADTVWTVKEATATPPPPRGTATISPFQECTGFLSWAVFFANHREKREQEAATFSAVKSFRSALPSRFQPLSLLKDTRTIHERSLWHTRGLQVASFVGSSSTEPNLVNLESSAGSWCHWLWLIFNEVNTVQWQNFKAVATSLLPFASCCRPDLAALSVFLLLKAAAFFK